MLRVCATTRDPSHEETLLRTYLCDRYWLPADEFPLCEDIFRALGITGDDCHEFMGGLVDQFDLDLADFIWPKFHLGEKESLDVRAALRPLRRFAGIRTQPMDRDLIPISIDHLMKVIALKRWIDPDIEHVQTPPSLGQSFSRLTARLRAGGVPRRQSR